MLDFLTARLFLLALAKSENFYWSLWSGLAN